MDGGDGIVFRFMDWIIGGMITIVTSVGSWLLNSAHSKIDEQAKAIEAQRRDHDNFRVFVSNEYAKSHALQSITDRIDNTLDEIRSDIKTLLQRK